MTDSIQRTGERLGTVSGLLAPLIALGAIAVATLVSPTFTWTESALSDLGGPGAPTAWLFNGGLLLGGIVALPFALRVFTVARNRLERVGAVLFGATGVALASIGVFPIGTPQHLPAAVSFYLLLSLSLWAYGAGNALAGSRGIGALTIGLGVLNLAAWVVWALAVRSVAPGLALPEIVGAVCLGGWTAGTALRLRPST